MCIVKARYGRGAESLRAHVSYIRRRGSGKNGERPEPFGNAEKGGLTTSAAGKLLHYRLVVSPETPEGFPLIVLAKKLIERVERDTGYSLVWTGTVHENTEHAHIHLVIGGNDKQGREVTFSRRYITVQLREHTRDILTEALGDRRPLPREEQLKKDIKASRFTRLDDTIRTAAGARESVTAEAIGKIATPVEANAATSRLKFLLEIGLVQKNGKEYRFLPDWEESLAISRRFASYLEATRQLKFTPRSLLRLYSPERDGRIVGHVSAIGLIDELSTNNYLLVETIDGRAFYVPLYKRPKGIAPGDSIALMTFASSGAEIPAAIGSSSRSAATSLLDVRFVKIPDEKLKKEVMRLGKKRSGFGLHLS